MTFLLLGNTHFMPESGVNLISQGQLQKKGCLFKIVAADIEIDQEKVIAKLIENNFYILDTPNFLLLLLSFIGVNSNTLRI